MSEEPRCCCRFARSFANALRGLATFFRSERHARFHAFSTVVAVLAAFLLDLEAWAKTAVVLAAGFVLAAEAFNTAIERLADRVTTESDPLIRDAKDLAAGAVLLAALTAIAVGLIVFLPRLIELFTNGFQGN